MGRLIESTFCSLDGVISAPQEWGTEYWDEQYDGYLADLLGGAEGLVLGRETYEGFAEAWPGRDGEIADRMNGLPKHVASRTLTGELPWNASVIEGDAADGVRALKERHDGDLLKYGSGELDQALIGAGLLDELHLWVNPVVAGGGDHLLEGLPLRHFDVRDRVLFDSGIVVMVLAPKS